MDPINAQWPMIRDKRQEAKATAQKDIIVQTEQRNKPPRNVNLSRSAFLERSERFIRISHSWQEGTLPGVSTVTRKEGIRE
jgi:hypothetical protein